jgi:hypothetical protein
VLGHKAEDSMTACEDMTSGSAVEAESRITPRLQRHEARGDSLQVLERVRAERLHADMVGARVEMRLHPSGHRLDVAPGDDRVDEAVAAVARDVLLGETKPEKVIAIVVERQVLAHVGPCRRTRLFRVAVEQEALFRC